MAQVPVSISDEQILYPFIEEGNEYLKFPKHQLCRQTSSFAIVAVDPSHITVQLSRSKNHKLLKSNVTEIQNQSPSENRESNVGELRQNRLIVNAELTLPSVDKKHNIIERDWEYTSSKSFVEPSETDIDLKSFSEMNDDDKGMSVIGQNLLHISKTNDFLMCDINTVCFLLSNDKLGVSDESVVFRAAYKWLKFRHPTRLVYGDEIMRCVRFGLMRPRDLVKCFVRCQLIGLMDSSDFCEQLFIGLLWSIATKYDLAYLVDELKPKERQAKSDYDSVSEDPVFSSGFSSRVTLVSNQSSMTRN